MTPSDDTLFLVAGQIACGGSTVLADRCTMTWIAYDELCRVKRVRAKAEERERRFEEAYDALLWMPPRTRRWELASAYADGLLGHLDNLTEADLLAVSGIGKKRAAAILAAQPKREAGVAEATEAQELARLKAEVAALPKDRANPQNWVEQETLPALTEDTDGTCIGLGETQ